MQLEATTTSTSTSTQRSPHQHQHLTSRRLFARKIKPSLLFIVSAAAISLIVINSFSSSSSKLGDYRNSLTAVLYEDPTNNDRPPSSFVQEGTNNDPSTTNNTNHNNNNLSPTVRTADNEDTNLTRSSLLSAERKEEDNILTTTTTTTTTTDVLPRSAATLTFDEANAIATTTGRKAKIPPHHNITNQPFPNNETAWTRGNNDDNNNNNNTTDPSCDFLSKRHRIPHNDSHLLSIMETPRIDKVQPHYFVFPKRQQQRQQQRQRQFMCVPQKNGNQQMAGLFFALHKQGRVLQLGNKKNSGLKLIWKLTKMNIHYVDYPPLVLSSSTSKKKEQADHKDGKEEEEEEEERHLFVISRNPYTRMLSYWMDKKQRTMKDANFTEFVQSLASQTQDHQPLQRLCEIDHHLCSQVSVCLRPALSNNPANTAPARLQTPTIFKLKLEEQASWFPCLLQVTNSNTSLLHGEQFAGFSGTPCFYTPTGNCSDMTRIVPPPNSLQNNNNNNNKKTVQVGKRHPTGASKREMMNLHHNAYTASVISNLYREDFELFDYPSWDGVSPWI